jgi:ATP-dependent helicase YprA (DUF1998 family)/SOS-response transcriptional repressor LexA
MALNPIVYTEKVVRSFLRYQLTAYPFADERLLAQMRTLLSLDATRSSPLLKGPFVSVSRPFRRGSAVDALVEAGVFHPHMRQRIPAGITHVYGHQDEAIRAIHAGRTTLVSTGTGSGKSECFLYPIVSTCLRLRDASAAPGISAVIVYPMNALAEDQLGRLRGLLAGTGISFGMYVGKTPEKESDVAGVRLPHGASRADYEAKLKAVRDEQRSDTVYPPEEVCSREAMRRPGGQPRILLTNVRQLELLLTRQRDVELFTGARLDFLVFDEAHTFTGAQGAETACLIRRLRAFCGRGAQDTVCIATSATIVDKDNPHAAREFASRFFGVDATAVTTVGEAYEREAWADQRSVPPAAMEAPAMLLAEVVAAVEDATGAKVRAVYKQLSGTALADGEWTEALYEALSRNEIAWQLAELLATPTELSTLPGQLKERVERLVSEEEILAWLTLGAAARSGSRPLLRPVVHAFIRGISGAVVTFPAGERGPRLWLAAEDELSDSSGGARHAHFPVTTCTTCGQHYFIACLKDFAFTGKRPGGGQATGDGACWEPLAEAQGGRRVVLLDRIIGGSGDDGADDADASDLAAHHRTAPLFFCRSCGAAHPRASQRCLHCGVGGELTMLYAVQQSKDNPGHLTSCLSCGTTGRRSGSTYREPARQVRAANVADVHVLAQDMVHHSERPRLLVFCDNRQDAAFQAGWMKDHARRFRLRALMAAALNDGPVSVGDLARHVDDRLARDDALSRALVPEVWQVQRKEGGGGRHERERRTFLRIQVLREVTLSSRQAIGLEPWGRMAVEYEGLETGLPWIQRTAAELGMPAADLRDGVASVLDYLRRKRVLWDAEREIFTHYWMDGDLEIQQGYLPQLGGPNGTKLRREPTEKAQLVTQWFSERGDTPLKQVVRKWGVDGADVERLLERLFAFLVERRLLRPVTLKGAKGKPLPGVTGVYQVDADRLRLRANHGVWRCASCRRRSTRRTPHGICPAWRCDGTLQFITDDPDNYDLQLLDEGYSMLRPEEHTAMVPHHERERLENLFKGDSDALNAFVCTPTLELGVDIGQLDAVLMRNVPPLPANYWQRAGRAGRRHRMAVNITYCRPVSHDRAYFKDPPKLLAGRVDPPAFNLRNELMVARHVHATAITRLHQYTRDRARTEADRQHIDGVLRSCLPDRIAAWLFDGDVLRTTPFDLAPLRALIKANLDDLCAYVHGAFGQGWPAADSAVATPAELRRHVADMVSGLEQVLVRLNRRLRWALDQIRRLNEKREAHGTLEPEDDALFRRCDALVKRLKGMAKRGRRDAEGYDDVNTFGVLAAEGFLPGYGLEVGSVLGTAEIPFWRTGAMEFTLPRPPSVALREYVPGNLIYANGNRFVARRFHRDADEQTAEMPLFEVMVERQAVTPTNLAATAAGLGTQVVQAISVCDVDLMHQSHISDDEELRFQLPVAVYGLERGQHNGGRAYGWGEQPVHLRRGVRFRLVNVGATRAIEGTARQFGYPVCTVCGQSVSPLSSDRQREQFAQSHEERCGRKVLPIGFYADVVADALTLPGCASQQTAYSVLEALRMAAAQVLDMTLEDLQVLVLGHVERDDVDAVLWDPMPGGSGLLDQLCARFPEIVAAARAIVDGCPSACGASCVDCLQTFRNAFYHKHLDRKLVLEQLTAWGERLALAHDIPPKQPSQASEAGPRPVNEAEQRLRHLLLAAGFEEGIRGEQLRLGHAIGSTTPDVIYRAADHAADEGVCIYLDGLGQHLHGNPETAGQDRRIRDWLRNNGYEVIEIAANELDDQGAMTRHFRKLAGYLGRPALRERLRSDATWYHVPAPPAAAPAAPERAAPRLVQPTAAERYVTCLPLIPLKVAASAFGDPQQIPEDGAWEHWVAVDIGRTLRRGMFVAQVVGASMEPRIPDGAYCVFASPVEGTRQGAIVLVQLRDQPDPSSGERYTVKRYTSETSTDADGTWRHGRITLHPLNRAFQPIELKPDDEGAVAVIAGLVAVLGSP